MNTTLRINAFLFTLGAIALTGCAAPIDDAQDEHREGDDSALAAGAEEGEIGEAQGALVPHAPMIRAVPRHSGKCLDVWEWSTANGAPIKQYDCLNGANQHFDLIEMYPGWFRIFSRFSGRCLDVPGAYLANGVPLQQWDCWLGDNQLFKLVDAGGGAVNLVAKHSGKCIGVYANSTANGADVVQWDCDGSDNQKFDLRRAKPDVDQCDSASPDSCVSVNQWSGGYPAANCVYGFHVGAGHYTTTGYSGYYDAIDRCAFWHDNLCWSVNHNTWVNEGLGGCSQTVNFISCVERVTPTSKEEWDARNCILNSMLEDLANICEPAAGSYGRGYLYPLYEGTYSGGVCASTYYAF